MGVARAGGTSGRKPSGNPPAISLSVDNDIEHLEKRGFDCSSPEARYVVERVTMHRLDAYTTIAWGNARDTTFRDGELIHHGDPELKEAHDLITYDRRVQSVILKYTGIIESQFRARYSRAMSALHGELALYDPSQFRRRDFWESAMRDAAREIGRQTKRSRSVRRAVEGGEGKVPIGLAVEYMTLGTLSKLYNNTIDRDVTGWVAGGMNASTHELRGWLRTIADVRNVCAHFNPYVVLRQIPTTPLPVMGCEFDNRSPFYIFPLMETILGSKEAKRMNDRNLDYASRMLEDVTRETLEFARLYLGTVIDLNVPKRFIDPSVKTWEGTAPRIV